MGSFIKENKFKVIKSGFIVKNEINAKANLGIIHFGSGILAASIRAGVID